MAEEHNERLKWSKASFRILGDTLEPDEVSGILGLQPTRSGRRGERMSPSSSKTLLRKSVWILQTPLSDQAPLQDHLEWLLDTLEPKRDAIGEFTKQYETDFFCGFSSENGQGGCTFESSLLARLANLGVPLVLDLYPPGPIGVEDIGTNLKA